MSLVPLDGFVHFPTHHCVTGSLRHIYRFNDYPISEEMLLGLGAGIGFIYWHMKDTLPFLGGRANTDRPGEEGLERAAGRRSGVRVETYRTASAAKAESVLIAQLSANQPVMLRIDMGFLPYFDFGGEEYHFGYHVVVACGYDRGDVGYPETRQVLLADRDEPLHPVSLDVLAKARGSKYKPFPPQNAWYSFDFTGRHPPEPGEARQAIRECAQGMLEPPIANLGVRGIRKAAERIRNWPRVLNDHDLRTTCINTAIMIDARGGSGGGLFRYMYGRFLKEAADLTGQAYLHEVGESMLAIGDQWQVVAGLFDQAYQAVNPDALLTEICHILPEIAQQEEEAWGQIIQ
jgi:hypothetical protein